MGTKKSKWLKKPIPMRIRHYSKEGDIFVDAECKILRNMKEVLVLETPIKGKHLHMGFRKSVITDENKRETKDERVVLMRGNFDKMLKGGEIDNE